jgi:flagellar protein FlgJ
MKPTNFVIKYWGDAKACEAQSGINPIAILAQAAVESGWGNSAPGNMFFGIKDTDGLNGNEQLLITTEYLARPDAKFPAVLSVTKTAGKLWKYVVKDYFRKYATPADSFIDHCKFFFKNSRYAGALKVKGNAYLFIDAIAAAGYATAPNYASLLKQVARSIETIAAQNNLK